MKGQHQPSQQGIAMTSTRIASHRTLVTAPERVTPSVVTGPRANPARRGPILLAIHGSEPTSAATTVARRLAELNELELKVVTVFESAHAWTGAPELSALAPMPAAAFPFPQAQALARRLEDTLGETMRWSLDVRYGSPAREINRAAREVDATLIVVDAAPRRGIRHVVAGARALQIVGHSSCPVLSVAPSSAILPRTILVAVDFSPASVRAAQAALLFAGSGTRVLVAHVALPIHLPHVVRDDAGAVFGGDIPALLTGLVAELDPIVPAGVAVETRAIDGAVVSGILALAESEQVELIAAGTHGPGPVERFFVGSVASGLFHRASCTVLISPPPGPR